MQRNIRNNQVTGGTGLTGFTGCSTAADINGDACFNGSEIISGSLNVLNELTVDQLAIFNGNVTVGPSGPAGNGSSFVTNSTVNMNTGLTIAAGDEIINAGNLTISQGTLTVGGSSTFAQPINTNNGVLILNGLTVNCGENINLGNLSVLTGNGIITGGLTVNGFITSAAGVSSFSDLTVSDTLNSGCATGPAALVVDGGVGIAKDLWLGGSEYFENVATLGGIPSAFDYYEEACFSTGFIWADNPWHRQPMCLLVLFALAMWLICLFLPLLLLILAHTLM